MRKYLPVLCIFVLMACHDKVICPAFQSTYILDDSTRYAFYSYVWQLDETTRMTYLGQNDSLGSSVDSSETTGLPKTDYYAYAGEKVVPWRVRGRNKYGIVKYEPYWLKKYRMRTAPMENVFAPKPEKTSYVASLDSTSSDSLVASETSPVKEDSIGSQSVAQVSGKKKEEVKFLYGFDPKDNFNVEQEYYLKYFAEKLIDNKPEKEPAPVDSLVNQEADSVQKEPFFKSLFSGLFKKKESEPDSLTTLTEEEPFTEEEAVEEEIGND